jgi:hypothetical protein
VLAALALSLGSYNVALPTWGQSKDRIQLQLKPQFCTLAKNESYCDAAIEIKWSSESVENLCLEILQFPEIERCWENAVEGSHQIELVFDTDLEVQLNDPQSQEIVASRTLKIVREAIQYRRKRLQPWNIFS